MKKIITLFLVVILFATPAFAVKGVKFIVTSCCDFDPDKVIDKYMQFKTTTNIEFDENLKIPIDSTITVLLESSTKEKRFHKSGYFKCKLIKYTQDGEEIDASSKNMDIIGRRYDKVDGKEAAKTGAELATTTAAAFIIPGIDIAYYFVKGAIQNEKAETRLKSGVHNAYDNSILWVFLKGKPIIFNKGDTVKLLMFQNDGSITDKEMEQYCE